METPKFSPIATITFNSLIYVQILPQKPDQNGVEMVTLKVQNLSGVYFTRNHYGGKELVRTLDVSVKKLSRGFPLYFILPLEGQTGSGGITRSFTATFEMNNAQLCSYKEQLARV